MKRLRGWLGGFWGGDRMGWMMEKLNGRGGKGEGKRG